VDQIVRAAYAATRNQNDKGCTRPLGGYSPADYNQDVLWDCATGTGKQIV